MILLWFVGILAYDGIIIQRRAFFLLKCLSLKVVWHSISFLRHSLLFRIIEVLGISKIRSSQKERKKERKRGRKSISVIRLH
jgi:hypothetical protein